jgi:ankyrin repeat protein
VSRAKTALLIALTSLTRYTGLVEAQGSGNPTKSLHQAARDGDIEQLKALIAKKVNLEEVDAVGWTPLRCTIEVFQPEAAKVLIEGGANVNGKYADGTTPLMLASIRGQKDVVEALLAKGASATAKDKGGRTALHGAVQMGRVEIAELLVKGGADVNAEDGARQVPLMLARMRNDREMVDFLVKNGAKEPPAMSLYGDYGGYPQGAAPGGTVSAPPAVQITIDANEIKAKLQQLPDVAAALEEVDKKSEVEQRGWAQRRIDNRIALLGATDRQFEDELAVVKKFTVAEKAEKTDKAIDDLTGKRRKRTEAVARALREQRREAMQSQSADLYGRGGRSASRAMRGSAAAGRNGMTGTSPYGPPGTATARGPRGTGPDANEPVIEGETQGQIQAWVQSRVEDKKSLLDAVHRQNLADLSAVEEVAREEEQAKKTSVAISALMMMHEERVQAIAQKWLDDDERIKKLQERYGTQGTPGTMPGDAQTGMRRGTRRR